MKAIVSIDENYGIGKNGQLIIHNKEDMKFFKSTTMGHVVVMGRKTFDSIGEPLSGRTNVVITKQKIEIPDVIVLNDWHDALEFKDSFVIGGAQIYNLFLPYYDEIYLTENKGIYDADAFFPKFDKSLYQKETLVQADTFNINKYTKLKGQRT